MQYAIYCLTNLQYITFCSSICMRMLHRETYNPRICLRKIYDEWKGKPDFASHGIINRRVSSCILAAATDFRTFRYFIFGTQKIVVLHKAVLLFQQTQFWQSYFFIIYIVHLFFSIYILLLYYYISFAFYIFLTCTLRIFHF